MSKLHKLEVNEAKCFKIEAKSSILRKIGQNSAKLNKARVITAKLF